MQGESTHAESSKVFEIIPSRIGISKFNGKTILSPKGSLTFQNIEELEAMLDELINKHEPEVLLDCKAVSFVDSEALELFLRVHHELKNRGRILKLININEICRDIMLATRLINVLHIREDIR